ncbi:hypothetical protein GE061_017149 [Apolygus lucorum]|uniref:SCP domain-containing protein n=1 Tax=Apolygus lucorum TaxID=248454 RepID=A0A8S9XK88_APOLU|nr:hypothetical protein GE061_017149 [Apolygus lucorum]
MIVFIAISPVYTGENYCTSKYKCGKEFNTMCTFRQEKDKYRCKSMENSMNAAFRLLILSTHNNFRQQVALGLFKPPNSSEAWPKAGNMKQLSWDYALEHVATRWAFQCQWGRDKCRRTLDWANPYQSVWHNWSELIHPLPNDALKYFQAQVKYFSKFPLNYTEDNKARPWGLFTQMIWGETYKIGCGYVTYKKPASSQPDEADLVEKWAVVVCNYAPEGNVVGKELYIKLEKNHPPPPAQKKCPIGWLIRDPSKIPTVYPDLCARLIDLPADIPIPDDPNRADSPRRTTILFVSIINAFYVLVQSRKYRNTSTLHQQELLIPENSRTPDFHKCTFRIPIINSQISNEIDV